MIIWSSLTAHRRFRHKGKAAEVGLKTNAIARGGGFESHCYIDQRLKTHKAKNKYKPIKLTR